ncbi:hypothetical protein OESDEN_15993 [Oesophagostomum dentatum]|uniref:Zinc knuckle n=1 Tax=Oesophagostomum dentatum TaxID=61180 RepID=A0A0B1SL83_OESDE|nr:hypothetical protein OESDEN_15993 [Oesophagostomum dentatum]
MHLSSPHTSGERYFCDHCDAMMDHDTESCPHRTRPKPDVPKIEVSEAPSAKVEEVTETPSSEEFCEFCSEYGHDTFSCPSFQLRRRASKSS